jgi:CBS domain-containing protein
MLRAPCGTPNIGDVIVVKGGSVRGVVTDRDIVVRAVAQGRDPKALKLGEIFSADVVTVSPDDSVDKVVNLMREKPSGEYRWSRATGRSFLPKAVPRFHQRTSPNRHGRKQICPCCAGRRECAPLFSGADLRFLRCAAHHS